MGDSINLINNFLVLNVVFNCGSINTLEEELINELNNKNILNYSCIPEIEIANNKLYFLNNDIYDNENDNSSVIYFKVYNYKFLFMGDASIKVEENILKKYNLYDIDILKVGHHGSKTSTGISFIKQINPKYSVISVGKNNIYKHPSKEVLSNLENSIIYRTDINGSIIFKFRNNNLLIETYEP